MDAYAANMGVSVTMLASGSRGNCAVVASACTKILVDAGISCRETFKRHEDAWAKIRTRFPPF